jgi:LPXTG-motif cell wall-anchored protein
VIFRRLSPLAAVLGLLVASATGVVVALTPAVAEAVNVCPAVPVLVNGGFEVPVVSGNGDANAANSGSPTPGIGWSTNDPGLVLEFWQSGFQGVPSDTGAQFTEINANAQDTIWQDVATAPGTKIRWRFAHRGRLGPDTMHFLVGAPSGTQTAQIPQGQSTADITDSTTAWGHYTGVYVVPAGQTTTRFTFASISETGPASFGNFLDSVSLEMLPTAADDVATTAAGQGVTIPVLSNDCGSGLSIHSVAKAAHGTVVISGGKVRYVPAPGFAGTDRFSDTIVDSFGTTAAALVTVHVVAPPGPTARPLFSVGPPGQVQIVHPQVAAGSHILLVGSDGRGVSQIVVPGEGVYAVSGITLTFTPDPGYIGTVQTVRYLVADSFGREVISSYTALVESAQVSGATLPRTGGDGTVPVAVAGLALVLIGIVLTGVGRRQRSDDSRSAG